MKKISISQKLGLFGLALIITLIQHQTLKATTLPVTARVTNYSGQEFHIDMLYQTYDFPQCKHERVHSYDSYKGLYPASQGPFSFTHNTVDTDHCSDQSVSLEFYILKDKNPNLTVTISPTNKFEPSKCYDQKGICNLYNFDLYYDRPNCEPGAYCAKQKT